MVKDSFDDTVTDGLSHDEFSIVWAVQEQLLGNVSECDLAVGQGDGPDGGLDHVVVKPHDEGVGVVSVELICKVLDHISKSNQVTRLDSLGQL